MIASLLRTLALTLQLAADGAPRPLEHAAAAVRAETVQLPAELLLAVAYVESRYDATAVSRVVDGRRVTGPWRSISPAGAGPYCCGVGQTVAATWPGCLAMRPLSVGYAALVAELAQWLRDRRVRGDVRLVLIAHGCGNAGLALGQCRSYDTRVLKRASRLGLRRAAA